MKKLFLLFLLILPFSLHAQPQWEYAGGTPDDMYFVAWETLQHESFQGSEMAIVIIREDRTAAPPAYAAMIIDCNNRTFAVVDRNKQYLAKPGPLPANGSVADTIAVRACGLST